MLGAGSKVSQGNSCLRIWNSCSSVVVLSFGKSRPMKIAGNNNSDGKNKTRTY